MITKTFSAENISDWRWQAVLDKDPDLDGAFFFGVRTTGIFCRPSCSSRTPRRENVDFFKDPAEAKNAGFRSCLRCRPDEAAPAKPGALLLARAFETLLAAEEIPTVDDLASRLGVSAGHLQKTFKSLLGVTPKDVIKMLRLEKFRKNVKNTDVTTALYESGFGSSRSLYEKAGSELGMTPGTYKKGGKNMKINYTITESPLGKMLVAATSKGICSVSFGDEESSLVDELRRDFFAAELQRDTSGLVNAVAIILKGLNGEKAVLDLPLDLRASAFQMRVWAELRKIPFGETRSYADVARELGSPNSVRAVARACATNPVAIITPCHRVVGSDGAMHGYRWGVDRKQHLLQMEKEKA